MNKRGFSGVISAVIMIALVMAAVLIVWTVVNNLVTEKLDSSKSCLDVFDKVSLDQYYTCYDQSENEFRFGVKIEDVEVDYVLISISSEGDTQSYKLTNSSQTISGLSYLNGTTSVKMPGKNSGKTYVSTAFSSKPDIVSIIPVVNGNQCDAVDTLTSIGFCSS